VIACVFTRIWARITIHLFVQCFNVQFESCRRTVKGKENRTAPGGCRSERRASAILRTRVHTRSTPGIAVLTGDLRDHVRQLWLVVPVWVCRSGLGVVRRGGAAECLQKVPIRRRYYSLAWFLVPRKPARGTAPEQSGLCEPKVHLAQNMNHSACMHAYPGACMLGHTSMCARARTHTHTHTHTYGVDQT